MFTLTDKVLIDRAARLINEQAKALRNSYGQLGWSTDETSRKQKLVYDRLLRDERDLRALAKRLAVHFNVKAAPRAPSPSAAAGTPGILSAGPAVARQLPAGQGNPALPMVLQHDDDVVDPVCPLCLKRDVAMCLEVACPAHNTQGIAHG